MSNEMINLINDNGMIFGSSREVAENFEKEHGKVLRSINEIIAGLERSSQKWRHLFIESEYINEQNKQVYKEYLMNRDGFSLLVMGFTGERALVWKMKYIEAFNKMEEELKKLLVPSYMIEDPIKRAEKWIEEEKEKRRLEEENKLIRPKADYTDNVLNSDKLVNISVIAKDFGLSAIALNKKLNELGVQYKQGEQWLLYAKYSNKGYTQSKTTLKIVDGETKTYIHTKWTELGRKFIHDTLRKEGILTTVEKFDNLNGFGNQAMIESPF